MKNTIETSRRFYDGRLRLRMGLSVARARGGQSLVELALTLPLFVLILLGTAEFAHFAWSAIETSNAARAGVAYGAQSHITASNTSGMEAAAIADGANLSALTATASYSCSCSTAPSTAITCSTALTTCPAPDVILEQVQVNTSATVSSLFSYPGLPKSFTAQGSAVMQVEQ